MLKMKDLEIGMEIIAIRNESGNINNPKIIIGKLTSLNPTRLLINSYSYTFNEYTRNIYLASNISKLLYITE